MTGAEQPLGSLCTALALGLITETLARIFGLWRYRFWWLPILSIALVFVLLQGLAIACLLGHGQPIAVVPLLFMTEAIAGLCIEALNEFSVHLWSWPDKRWLSLSAPLDKAALVGVAWGCIPVTVYLMTAAGVGS